MKLAYLLAMMLFIGCGGIQPVKSQLRVSHIEDPMWRHCVASNEIIAPDKGSIYLEVVATKNYGRKCLIKEAKKIDRPRSFCASGKLPVLFVVPYVEAIDCRGNHEPSLTQEVRCAHVTWECR